jgi:hypothetical protein
MSDSRRTFLQFLLAGSFAAVGRVRTLLATGGGQKPVPPRQGAPARPLPPATAIAADARTVRLSDAALRSRLPEKSWLRFYRDFIARTGAWQGHPTDARMMARRQGRIAAVGPERAPIGDLLGYGQVQQVGDGVGCSTNVCETLGVAYRSTCSAQSCGKNSCADLNCTTNTCGGQNCAKLACDSHSAQISDFIAELNANWDTPLVMEMRQQFGSNSTADLARAVSAFVFRNGYGVR